ncbi:hypothetical protein SAMN05216559_0037 [Halomicrobium zhouii]|uniref:Cytochrome C and Quinol oxidase polypeptide I n=1 Tax=Halomicrobium zhouii TaxID=767519 RepID=A0A1I6K2U0_9EURY|nr:hypothetical protein [Halomicrobium zhouii]SFR85130.1 hypothetical protein SAMN05216559_0037 [Halomicrobium zhouii]
MSAIPADVDADRGPPTVVPLGHFLVGLAFLLAGVVTVAAEPGDRGGTLGTVHLLLAGWVCVTIMGAMTQFVPVWSNVGLYSRRLAVWQLGLVTLGLAGLASAFLTGRYGLAPIAGLVAALGFWTFVYNLGRTLRGVEEFDVTERHFAVALAWFLAVTTLGPLLALDLTLGLFPVAGVDHAGLLGAHATLAVFGAVLTTVVGALYQLATMFTQTELGPVERRFQRAETVAYPVGVAALALGRLLAHGWLARAGGLVVAVSLVGVGLVLANRLRLTRVDWNPMLTRYSLVAGFAVAWGATAAVAWWIDPLASLYGAPNVGPLLLAGVVGFVVAGTLYHIVPFLIWVREYSDLLGFEPVPMVDDLYDGRVAAVELLLVLGGGALLAGGDALGGGFGRAGAVVLAVGAALFAANLALVVVRHGDDSIRGLLPGSA